MKKLKLSILALLAIAAVAPSCKKGEEDPALSLSSRKSRFAGEWKVSTYEETSTGTTTYNNANPVYTSTTTGTSSIKDGALSASSTNTSTQTGSTPSTNTATGTATEYTYTFEKDGTWKAKRSIKITAGSNTFGGSTTTSAANYTETYEWEGTWQFLGKNKSQELKNKEAVVLSILKETYSDLDISTANSQYSSSSANSRTWAVNENTMIWNIVMLKGKEMKVTSVGKSSSEGSITNAGPGSTTTTKNNSTTNESTGTITLTQ
jgi:hypothetical protein